MMLKRTAKSCRSDAPMLASSLREEAQATVSNKPGHRGEREVSRKSIARGMPGDFRCDRGDYARVFVFFHTRGCGRIERPAFAAPSEFLGGWFLQELGRIAPRGRGRMLVCHCEERSDEAIQKPSFRGDAEHRTRNLEIPRCAIAHPRSGAGAPSRNDGFWIASRHAGLGCEFTKRTATDIRHPRRYINPARHVRAFGVWIGIANDGIG